MMHSASLPDSTLAYPHFNPCPPGPIASSTSYYSTCGPSLDHPSAMLSNGHARSPGSTNGLSPATSATVAALTAAAAASAGFTPNVKDSRWLTLEVCRQYQRNQCTRDENECKFAHPPIHVDVQNGRVICCYDSIKGKCQRRDPPCKYLHPPQHLREQLMQNGRNNMIIRNMQLQLFQHQLMAQSGMLPLTPSAAVAAAAVAAAQAAAVASPVSTTNSPVNGANGTPSSLIYPGPGPLAIGAPVPTSTYPFLSMGFTPYLNAITSSGLPTGTSTVAVQLPGTEILPSADTNTSTTQAKRPTLNDTKNGLPLYMPRTNGVHVSNGTNGKVEGQDNNSGAGGCMMVMNGGPMDSLTAAAAAREMTGSPHSCSVTMRSSANTGTNLSVAAAAAATLYALQHPHGPPNAATLLNMHPTHPAAGHPHPMASLQAAPLTAAMMNGSASNMAQAHFSAVPDPTGFFQPACHIEIPSYPYQ